MKFPRASGILLHPTSLPSDFGIGDLGPAAFKFVDFLAKTGQTYWQILPLGPTGFGNSPYSSYSAFAGTAKLISPEVLVEDGFLSPGDIASCPSFAPERVDYQGSRAWKNDILATAFENFPGSSEFGKFCHENSWWLDDYATFRTLKAENGGSPWNEWPEPHRSRDNLAIEEFRATHERGIDAERFTQFLFFRQWSALRSYANENGVYIIGDIPIFAAFDSADVWCNQNKFKLSADGQPEVVAGVPPDYFSSTGQLWGNPIYDWDAMLADNFNWWTARIAFAFQTVDIVRLDHFIGFSKIWEVPFGDKTAENGRWLKVPGRELFTIIRQRLGDLPIIAEDLGSLTEEVERLRDDCGFPGMRILQYAFGGDAQNRDLPHNYTHHSVAYTGTHDNNTTAGWYKTADRNAKAHCRDYLGVSGRNISWDMIRQLHASVADTAIVPLQDILSLGSDTRMNTPATVSGNWEWRLLPGAITDTIGEQLGSLTALFGRDGRRDSREEDR